MLDDEIQRLNEVDRREFSTYVCHRYSTKPLYEMYLHLGNVGFLPFLLSFSGCNTLRLPNRKSLARDFGVWKACRMREAYLRAYKEKRFTDGAQFERAFMRQKKALGLSGKLNSALNLASKEIKSARRWRVGLEMLEVARRKDKPDTVPDKIGFGTGASLFERRALPPSKAKPLCK